MVCRLCLLSLRLFLVPRRFMFLILDLRIIILLVLVIGVGRLAWCRRWLFRRRLVVRRRLNFCATRRIRVIFVMFLKRPCRPVRMRTRFRRRPSRMKLRLRLYRILRAARVNRLALSAWCRRLLLALRRLSSLRVLIWRLILRCRRLLRVLVLSKVM